MPMLLVSNRFPDKMRRGILFMLHISYAFGHITVAPRNAAVVAGDMMSMECRTDEDFRVRRWELLKVGGGTTNVYLHGDQSPYDKEFTHFGAQVNASGSGIIYANSTRMDDAGLYKCVTRQGSDGKTVKVNAQLTVFESQPVCETNLTVDGNKSLAVGDFIWLRCSVAFRGFWTPTMEWRQHSGNGDIGNILTGGVEIVRLPNTSVTSTLIMKVDSSMKGVFFSCRTFFTDYEGIQLSPDDTANNIPNFNYTWNSEAVALPYGMVPETDTIAIDAASSSDWTLLVAGLTVFFILFALLFVVLLVNYKEKIFRRRRVTPDVIQHEDLNMQGYSYATYAEVTIDQTEQRFDSSRQLPEGHTVQPVYAVVNKPNCKTDAGAAAQIRKSSTTYTGADGTQYIDVNQLRDRNARVAIKHPPMFSLVETYASIDHTSNVPPPLPSRSQKPN